MRSAGIFWKPKVARLADFGDWILFAKILSHFQQKNPQKLNGVYNNVVKQKTASEVFY